MLFPMNLDCAIQAASYALATHREVVSALQGGAILAGAILEPHTAAAEIHTRVLLILKRDPAGRMHDSQMLAKRLASMLRRMRRAEEMGVKTVLLDETDLKTIQ